MKAFSHDLDSAFPTDTYWGRLRHFQRLINPFNLLTPDQQLLVYKQKLQEHKQGLLKEKLSDHELWTMKYRNYTLQADEKVLLLDAPLLCAY